MAEDVERSVNAVTGEVIDAGVHVHEELGPGLLERVYRVCLAQTLEDRGLDVVQEVVLPVTFEGEELDAHYRVDLLVDGTVPLELKACEESTVTSVDWSTFRFRWNSRRARRFSLSTRLSC
jgi:GxxExxY protein